MNLLPPTPSTAAPNSTPSSALKWMLITPPPMWYLKRVDDAVQEAKELSQGGTLSLIGHSAGGCLARLYKEEFGFSDISLLLTLGTPHLPPPKVVSGVIDQTRGLLDYVNKRCSKAVYTRELKYVCIAGRYIQGARLYGNSNESIVSALPIEGVDPSSDVAFVSDATVSTSTSTTIALSGKGTSRSVGRQMFGELELYQKHHLIRRVPSTLPEASSP